MTIKGKVEFDTKDDVIEFIIDLMIGNNITLKELNDVGIL